MYHSFSNLVCINNEKGSRNESLRGEDKLNLRIHLVNHYKEIVFSNSQWLDSQRVTTFNRNKMGLITYYKIDPYLKIPLSKKDSLTLPFLK